MDEKQLKQHYDFIRTLEPEKFIEELNKMPPQFVMKELYGVDFEEEQKKEKELLEQLKALVAKGMQFEEALDVVYGKAIEVT